MISLILDEDLEKIHNKIKSRTDWKNSVVIVTGCAGFLGFYFMHYFAHKGKDLGIKKIIGLDNFSFHKPNWIDEIKKNFPQLVSVKQFDVSCDDISEVDKSKNANYIIHAASIASPFFYRKFPIQTIDANITGLRKFLEFYKNSSKLKGFLFFSSSEIYGDPDFSQIPTSEEYRGNVSCVGPRACYDESKRFGETLCWVFNKQFNMPLIIARPFNNFGPGMMLSDKRLPADLANCILNNQDIFILSNGSPKRTFCYISDAIVGYLLCLTYGSFDYFNIGIDKPEISVNELAMIFMKVGKENLNYNGKIIYKTSEDKEYLTDNPIRRCPSIEKAKLKLGFNPKINVEDGVRRYLKYLSNKN